MGLEKTTIAAGRVPRGPLRRIRENLGVTQQELATFVGIKNDTIRSLEYLDADRLMSMPLWQLLTIAHAVGVAPSELVRGLNKPPPKSVEQVRPSPQRLARKRQRKRLNEHLVKARAARAENLL